MNGLLLFAHGSRDPLWFAPFERLRERVAADGTPVALAYLEFAKPELAEAAAQLAAQGCTQIRVVPVFLAAGAHVRADLPELIEAARASLPGVAFELRPPVGEDAAVLDAIARVALG
ncbi:cobalamin biosynthesis protein CbiX [beta proteobacterium AAP99]|nr:cobalamin biosynthesis protein CbiX [beta proteobacterium AAP99]